MKKALKIIAILLVVILLGSAIAWFGYLRPEPPPISEEDRLKIELMPLPSALELKGGKLYLSSPLAHASQGFSSKRIERAFKRFSDRVEEMGPKPGRDGSGEEPIELLIRCDSASSRFPGLDEKESYQLKIREGRIELSAAEERGVLHGLESLFQLIRKDERGRYLTELEMDDAPRYPWRGLMIDVSRHWIPKEVILRNLDAMAAVKMNVLHLHLTDHQGFRIESKIYPKLHEMGSGGQYFTQEDIREMVDYASDRGIRIVPEFDLPGHTASWFPGYPELSSNDGPHVLYRGVIGNAIMNPAREQTFEFLEEFFGEMSSLFPDAYLHVGADEARAEDWESNAEIQEFAKTKGFKNNHDLYAYFNQRVYEIVKGHGKKLLGWDEIREAGLPALEIGVQTWRDHKSLWQSAREGSQALLSAGYYLDHKQPAGFHYGVDPEVIKGAVDIEIDSTHWESWKCKLKFSDTEFDGDLYLFGQHGKRRGIMGVMGNLYGFEEVKEEGGTLEYDIEGPMGTAAFQLRVQGDSLFGESSLSVFTLELSGIRSGGSGMQEGLALPEFEKIEPLTESQRLNLLGGEACMWTEMADSVTLESRIWPRAGAIAEKLWSPKELTDETKDMYRRLMSLNGLLEDMGLQHRSYRESLFLDRVDERYRGPLRDLINMLSEDRLFNRMTIYDPPFDVDTALNRVVDAAAPESYAAIQFEWMVDDWSGSGDKGSLDEIRKQLNLWASVQNDLQLAFQEYPFLRESEPHARHLSRLAELALMAIDDPDNPKLSPSEVESLLLEARKAYGGALLSGIDGFERLIKGSGDQDN